MSVSTPSGPEPGWYPDPADTTVQRYWDGEGWLGEPLPAGAPVPPTPPTAPLVTPAAPDPAPLPDPPAAPPIDRHSAQGPTPYRVASTRLHGYPLAPLGARLLARLVDVLVVLGLNVVVNWWLAIQWWAEMRPYLAAVAESMRASAAGEATTLPQSSTRASWLLFTMLAVATALWFAYEVPAIANNGQTLGKRLTGIKVVALDSPEPLGFRRAARRWNTLGMPTLLWWCYVGFLLQFIDCLFVVIDQPLHQALHDRAVRTVVVRATEVGVRRPEGA